MNDSVDVIVERESANDTTAVVVDIFCRDGARINRGDVLFTIETSKTVQEVVAPADGVLLHDLRVGDTIALAEAIARIVSKETAADAILQRRSTRDRPAGASARLSRAASAFAEQHGLTAADFTGDFVTLDDVRRRVGGTPPVPSGALRAQQLPDALQPLSPSKRVEIARLRAGAGATMLSVLGTGLGTEPFERRDAGFFAKKISDLVIYEASLLMREYRNLNAAYRDGGVEYHAHINAGFAIDGGGRLVVYGISDSADRDAANIREEIMEGLKKYAQGSLTARDTDSATFTVTDLSSSEIDFILPLLPEGQTCILAITHTVESGYRLYIGFDHRVTEGLEASRFLQKLRHRLLAALAPHRPGASP